MSYRVVITKRALADLTAIRDYIAKRSPDNAAGFIAKILGQFDLLEQTPESFSRAPEDESVPYTVHQVIVKPYRILYCVTSKQVQILHIRHGARLPAAPEEFD
jgi:plasmid stabilization system protein ParE